MYYVNGDTLLTLIVLYLNTHCRYEFILNLHKEYEEGRFPIKMRLIRDENIKVSDHFVLIFSYFDVSSLHKIHLLPTTSIMTPRHILHNQGYNKNING